MSTRAIGQALGVNHVTVKRDRETGVTNVTPATRAHVTDVEATTDVVEEDDDHAEPEREPITPPPAHGQAPP